jgi:ribosomal protein L11 methylase PrmA
MKIEKTILLSLMKSGAKKAIGFDISDNAINEAKNSAYKKATGTSYNKTVELIFIICLANEN